jgi:hypothetical protein
MDIIEDEIDIKKMHIYQLTEMNNEEYKKYIKYLHLYYLKEHKRDKYNKDYLDGKYILYDKSNPKKKIMITPSKFINIHKLYIDLKSYSDIILNKISEIIDSKTNINENNRIDFEILKKKYLSVKNKIKDIEYINKEFYNEMEILLTKRIEISNELVKYYQKRNIEYSNIKVMITENLKNKLIQIFKEKNKKIPTLNEINKIAKENSVPSNEIERWFSWIESVYFYMYIKNEIKNINKKIEEKEDFFEKNTRYMIIKKPTIEE